MLTLQTRQWQHWRVFFLGYELRQFTSSMHSPATAHIASTHSPPCMFTKQTRWPRHQNDALQPMLRHHYKKHCWEERLAAPVPAIRVSEWLPSPTPGLHMQNGISSHPLSWQTQSPGHLALICASKSQNPLQHAPTKKPRQSPKLWRGFACPDQRPQQPKMIL